MGRPHEGALASLLGDSPPVTLLSNKSWATEPSTPTRTSLPCSTMVARTASRANTWAGSSLVGFWRRPRATWAKLLGRDHSGLCRRRLVPHSGHRGSVPDRLAVLVAQFSQGGLHGAFIEPLANSDRRPGCEGTLGALHCCLSLRQ